MKRIVVTGIGMMAANGRNKEEVFAGCLSGETGLKKCRLFDFSKLKTAYVGEIDGLPKEKRMNALVHFAAKEAMADAKLSDFRRFGRKGYLSFATLLAHDVAIRRYLQGEKDALFDLSALLREIKRDGGVLGGSYTDMAACAAGTTALGIAYDLLRVGKADAVLCGGSDCLTDTVCFGFHALQALSDEKCHPFDKKRDGINIGESGVFFVVEREESAKERGAHIYAEIVGYGLNNDGYHITSPDPNGYGARKSILSALGTVKPEKVGYINTHGTGTPLNDGMEATVIREIFGDKPLVSSTKGATGHCLASAGSLEAAVTVMGLERGIFPPTVGLTEREEGCGENYIAESKRRETEYALSDSFAFYGNTAAMLFKKWED